MNRILMALAVVVAVSLVGASVASAGDRYGGHNHGNRGGYGNSYGGHNHGYGGGYGGGHLDYHNGHYHYHNGNYRSQPLYPSYPSYGYRSGYQPYYGSQNYFGIDGRRISVRVGW
jgi:hypothetical protein